MVKLKRKINLTKEQFKKQGLKLKKKIRGKLFSFYWIVKLKRKNDLTKWSKKSNKNDKQIDKNSISQIRIEWYN